MVRERPPPRERRSATVAPRDCHGSALCTLCMLCGRLLWGCSAGGCSVAALWLLCDYLVSALRLLCGCSVAVLWLLCGCCLAAL